MNCETKVETKETNTLVEIQRTSVNNGKKHKETDDNGKEQ